MKIASLFCGAGGFDYGFKKAGFQTIAAYDVNKNALDVFNNNVENVGKQVDISTVDDLGFLKDADIILSGSPCQGFSVIGKRDYHDPRNLLLIKAGAIVANCKPKFAVFENVKGVLSGTHKQYWEKLIHTLTTAGYHCQSMEVDCEKIGMAQIRKRVILIASLLKITLPSTIPVNGKKLLNVICDIPFNTPNHSPVFISENSADYAIAEKIHQGQKLCNVRGGTNSIPTWEIPNVFGSISKDEIIILEAIRSIRRRVRVRNYGDSDPVELMRIENILPGSQQLIQLLIEKKYIKKTDNTHIDLCHSFNGKFKRLRWDKPSYTVDTQFGNYRFFLHPDEHRGFTVREAARIQGFEDNFIFSGPLSEQYKMVGNAVPPPLGQFIANIIISMV